MRQRHFADYSVGIILGLLLFVVFPAFIIAGAQQCVRAPAGLPCAIVTFAFDDGPLAAPERIAKAR